MKDILFNGHDIALIIAIGLNCVLALRASKSKCINTGSKYLLIAFFLLNAFNAVDTLLFWGDGIKTAAFDLSPKLPLLFSFSSFAMGPVFYWLIRNFKNPKRRILPWEYLHLTPAILSIFYLYWIYYQFPIEKQRTLILDHLIFSRADTYFLYFLTLKKLVLIGFAIAALRVALKTNRQDTQSIFAHKKVVHFTIGFGFIWCWVLVTHILGQWLPISISDALGILGNYMALTLVIMILLQSQALSHAHHENSQENVQHKESRSKPRDDTVRIFNRLQNFMTEEKPYLNTQLTLERLAKLVNCSSRQVSNAINNQADQNFCEYVNGFRVEEAKRLLRDPHCDALSILEVAQHSGFNSKATFNRFFKSLTGCTPSAYRQQPTAAPFSHASQCP